MNTALRFIGSILIFFAFLPIVFDFAQINHIKKDMKDTLDISTKAAALQLDEDPIKIGKGIFEIDVEKAKEVNKDIYLDNLGARFNTSIVSTEVINTHVKKNYMAPNGKQFEIDNPTIFSTAKYHYDGFFFSKDIEVYLISGSVLRNKNDLK